jgi:addiction module HigA family antidote
MGNLGYGFCPTHPGEILKEEIEYRNISQRSLAAHIGMSYSVINEIMTGQRPLTPASALLFEAALGVKADTLMRMQLKYNMQVARNDKRIINRLNGIHSLQVHKPVRHHGAVCQ